MRLYGSSLLVLCVLGIGFVAAETLTPGERVMKQ